MSRGRLALIGAAVVVVAVTILVTTTTRPGPTPTVPPAPVVRHYVINLDRAIATFGEDTAESTGSLRLRAGDGGAVEALSVAVEAVSTARGSSGPILLSLVAGVAGVTQNGQSVQATFPFVAWYPLVYQVGGEKVVDDVVQPERTQVGTATFQGRIDGQRWAAQITLHPEPVEGTDFGLPEGKIDIQSPVLFETDVQASRRRAQRIWCVDTRNDQSAFAAKDVRTAERETRQVWRAYGVAILTSSQIATLNERLRAISPASGEVVDPPKVPVRSCTTVKLVRTNTLGGGATSDLARRTITIGANSRTTGCPSTTLGRMTAHHVGHVVLLIDRNEAARGADNLMRACAPGTVLEEDQRSAWSGFAAEIVPELTVPGIGDVQNVAARELTTFLDELDSSEVSEPDLPTSRPTGSPTRTSRPTASPAGTPSSTPAPTPAPTASPTPAPTASPTPEPTASPGASP